MHQLKKITAITVIEYFRKLEIEISEEDAILILEHLTDIAAQALNEYFTTLNSFQK